MTAVARSLPQREAPVDRLGRIEPYANRLHTAVQNLLTQRCVSVSPFRSLARDLLLDVRERPELQAVLPEPGPSPDDRPIAPDSPAESAVYTAGIQTARLIAWTASHRQAWLDRRELITTAALLQDVGLLLVTTGRPMTPRQLLADRPQLFRRHPEFGAALAGGITDSAVDLPQLIAQHHERLDGTGYPRQTVSRHLPETSRFLAIAVRFVELWHEVLKQENRGSNRPRHLAVTGVQADVSHRDAAEALFREAVRGDWDRTLVIGLLESLGFRISDQSMFADEIPRSMALSRFGRLMIRTDTSHATIRQPRQTSAPRTAAASHPAEQ